MSTTGGNMRALRFYGKEDMRLDIVPIPPCGPDEVRVKPAFTGICGTDAHEYSRGPTLVPTSADPLIGDQALVTLGHEICGLVDEVGSQVSDIELGQRVVIQPVIADRTCRACLLGRTNVCPQRGFFGISRAGGLADFIVVGRRNVEVLPSTIPLEIGALVEPLAVGWHAIRQSGVNIAGSSALVMGAGPIGLAVIQGLAVLGAKQIIVCEPSESKRATALKFGATHGYDPGTEDVPARCRDIGHGEGVHVAFDCVGKQVTIDQAVDSTGNSGTIVNIAIWGGLATISPNAFAIGEKRFVGSSVYTDADFREVIAAIADGTLKPADMITSRVALDRVVSDGIEGCLIKGIDKHIKVLVDLSL